jgi:PASTA domain
MRRLLLFAAVVCALGATATLTYAAGRKLSTVPAKPPAAAPLRATLVVPDVRHEAFVFAKGALQDGGFAWRVTGGVHGFPANTVVEQSPAPGTKLVDTGAPLVTIKLTRNGKYKQTGEPQDVSPYAPTRLRYADAE